MADLVRERILSIALVAVGVIFIVGIWGLGIVWPSGWVWHDGGQSHYLQMIIGFYAVLGVFLIAASRNPREHRSLIVFTIWSSVAHALIMAVQAIGNAHDRGHLIGDVPALLLVAALLAVLAPRRAEAYA